MRNRIPASSQSNVSIQLVYDLKLCEYCVTPYNENLHTGPPQNLQCYVKRYYLVTIDIACSGMLSNNLIHNWDQHS